MGSTAHGVASAHGISDSGHARIELARFPLVLKSRRGLVAACTVTFALAAAAAHILLPQKYTAVAAVVIDSRGVNHLLGGPSASVAQSTLIATQLSIVASERVAREVATHLDLAQDPVLQERWQAETGGQGEITAWIATRLLRRLAVSRNAPDSNVLNLAFTDPDPVRAAELANAFAQTYLGVTLELNVSPARMTARFFDERTTATREALRTAQTRLFAYQREHGIVSGNEKLDIETAQMNELATALTVSKTRRIDSRSRTQYASGSASEFPDVLQNPVVQALTTEVARAQAKLKELSSSFGVNHPQFRAARDELAELEMKLAEQSKRVARSVNVTEQVSSQGEKDIVSALNAQRQRVLQLKKRRDQLSVLERDVESAQKAYDQALQRHSQTTQESQSGLNDASMLTPAAVPFESTRRSPTLTVPFAAICGFLLGLVAALALEHRAPRIREGRDIAEWFDLPILGVVSCVKVAADRRSPGRRSPGRRSPGRRSPEGRSSEARSSESRSPGYMPLPLPRASSRSAQ